MKVNDSLGAGLRRTRIHLFLFGLMALLCAGCPEADGTKSGAPAASSNTLSTKSADEQVEREKVNSNTPTKPDAAPAGQSSNSAPSSPNTAEGNSEVTKRGTVEVVAELVEIPEGAIFQKDLYNYATVLKYRIKEIRRGKVDGDVIYVAHYNPFKPRDHVADKKAPGVGGDLQSFEAGQVHHMALETPVDDFYLGGIVNKYFGEKIDPLYWAVWTSPVKK